jgi:predicted dehydrogenase
MTAYRVAIIGTGGIAGEHMRALNELKERAQVVAAVDIDRARVEAFSAKRAIPRFYTDVAAMLTQEQPDLVHIATPPGTHYDLVIQCLSAGSWVLCEKPLCLSLAQLDQIVKTEQLTGKYCSSVFQWRFGSGARHLKQLIQQQAMGRPLVGICQTTWYRDQAYFEVPWRGKWATEGGGPTMGHGIHAMDLFLWLLGEWQEISALTGTLDRSIEVEDLSMATVRFQNGALGSIVNSVLSPRQETYLRFDFQKTTVELTALYSYSNKNWRYSIPEKANTEAELQRWQAIPTDLPSSHRAQLALLLDCMERNERPLASTVDVRATFECISALYKSAATGCSVRRGSIDHDDPFYWHVAGHAEQGTGER